MSLLLNRAKMTTTTTGTGTVTLGEAVSPYQSFSAAGAQNGGIYSYLIEDVNGAWELGSGTYTSSGTTFSRTLDSSSTSSLLNLSGLATVAVVSRAADPPQIVQTVKPSSASSVTFSTFPALANAELEVMVTGTSAAAGVSDEVFVQLNGDTGANYSSEIGLTAGTAFVASLQSLAANQAAVGFVVGAGGVTSDSGYVRFRIPAYSDTNFFKTISSQGVIRNSSASGQAFVTVGSGWWNSTSAVTSVKVFINSGSNFSSATIITLRVIP